MCPFCFHDECGCQVYVDRVAAMTPAERRDEERMIAAHVAESDGL